MEDLVRRMQAGEEVAFAAFAEAFGPRFRAYFSRHGLLIEDCDDLAICTITDVAMGVGGYREAGDGSFERWAFRIAHRNLVDWRRRTPEYKAARGGKADAISSTRPTHAPNDKVVEAMRTALATLSPLDQDIVLMRLYDEPCPYAELAELLGVSEGAARVRHHRAREHLRRLLEEDPAVQEWLREGAGSRQPH